MNEQQMRQMMEQMRKEMEAQYNKRLADLRLELKDPYQYRRQQDMKRFLQNMEEYHRLRQQYAQSQPQQPTQSTPQQSPYVLSEERQKRLQRQNEGFDILKKSLQFSQQPSGLTEEEKRQRLEKIKENIAKRRQGSQPPTASQPMVSTPAIRGTETPMGGMGGLPSLYGSMQMTPYRPNYDAFFQQYGGMMGSFGSPQLGQTQHPLFDAFRAGLMNRLFGG